MNKPVKIAIIGCGYIAQKAYLPLFSQWPSVEIVGVFSRSEKRLKEVAECWPDLPKTNSLASLLENPIDAAFVLTPAASHFSICRDLMAQGMHVFVEKPPTTSSADTIVLHELAVECGVLLMVGFNRRFAPLVVKAKEILAGRKINVCLVEKHRPTRERRDLHEAYLEDLIHQIDLLRFFGGEALALATEQESRDDCLLGAVSTAGYRNGGLGVVVSSREAGRWLERVSIFGDGVTIELQMFREMRCIEGGRELVFGRDRPGSWLSHLEERGFVGEIQHFLDCIRNGTRPVTDARDAGLTQLLLEAFIQKSKSPSDTGV
jgi:virulence factor